MRSLLDGVAMPVPRRSAEPGRPRHRRESAPDALVDFHTGNGHFSVPNWVPPLKGLADFKGRVIHAHSFRDAQDF